MQRRRRERSPLGGRRSQRAGQAKGCECEPKRGAAIARLQDNAAGKGWPHTHTRAHTHTHNLTTAGGSQAVAGVEDDDDDNNNNSSRAEKTERRGRSYVAK